MRVLGFRVWGAGIRAQGGVREEVLQGILSKALELTPKPRTPQVQAVSPKLRVQGVFGVWGLGLWVLGFRVFRVLGLRGQGLGCTPPQTEEEDHCRALRQRPCSCM